MSKLVRIMDVSLGTLSNLERAKGFEYFTHFRFVIAHNDF